MTNLILNLPDDLLYALFDDWIDPQSLTKLDTSFCNKFLRPVFLDYLPNVSVLMTKSFRYYMKWVTARRLKLLNLLFTDSEFRRKKFHFYLDLVNKSAVNRINIEVYESEHWSEDKIAPLINSCPSLTSLCFNGVKFFNSSCMLKIEKKILGQLQEFVVDRTDYHKGISDFSLQFLHATNLRVFNFSKCAEDSAIAEFNFIQFLIRKNPHLHTFICNGDHSTILSSKVLDALKQFCPNISEVKFRMDAFSGMVVARFLNECKNIKTFDVGYNQPGFTYGRRLTYTNYAKTHEFKRQYTKTLIKLCGFYCRKFCN